MLVNRQLAFNSCFLSLETIGRKKVVHNMKLYLPREGERVCDCVEVRVSECVSNCASELSACVRV